VHRSNELKFRGLQHWQVGGFLTVENAADIMADFAVAGHEIGPVAFVAQNPQTNFLKLLRIALIGCGGSKNRVVSTTGSKS
jgi:hypothetical protein